MRLSARSISFLGLLMIFLLPVFVPISAQEDSPNPEKNGESTVTESELESSGGGERVTLEGYDGRILVGEYWAGGGPSILLIHQLYTNRSSWYPIIPQFQAAGYRVLAVDLRGYGETGGPISWSRTQNDIQDWIEWLLDHGTNRDSVFLMGSSMGANLALKGCADYAPCAGAVAISPGRNYFGVYTTDAVTSGIPALLIYGDTDTQPRRDVPLMMTDAEEAGYSDRVQDLALEGRIHGMDLFWTYDDLTAQIIGWLQTPWPRQPVFVDE